MLSTLHEYILHPAEYNREMFKIQFFRWMKELISLLNKAGKLSHFELYVNHNNLLESLYRIATKETGDPIYLTEETRFQKFHSEYSDKLNVKTMQISALETRTLELERKLKSEVKTRRQCQTRLEDCRDLLKTKSSTLHDYELLERTYEQKIIYLEKQVTELQIQAEKEKYFYFFQRVSSAADPLPYLPSDDILEKRQILEDREALLSNFRGEQSGDAPPSVAASFPPPPTCRRQSYSDSTPPPSCAAPKQCSECATVKVEMEALREKLRLDEDMMSRRKIKYENEKKMLQASVFEMEELVEVEISKNNNLIKRYMEFQEQIHKISLGYQASIEQHERGYLELKAGFENQILSLTQGTLNEAEKPMDVDETDLSRLRIKLFDNYIENAQIVIQEFKPIVSHIPEIEPVFKRFEHNVNAYVTFKDIPAEDYDEETLQIEELPSSEWENERSFKDGILAEKLEHVLKEIRELKKEIKGLQDKNQINNNIIFNVQNFLGVKNETELNVKLARITSLQTGDFDMLLEFYQEKIKNTLSFQAMKSLVQDLENFTDIKSDFRALHSVIMTQVLGVVKYYGGYNFLKMLHEQQKEQSPQEDMIKTIAKYNQLTVQQQASAGIVFDVVKDVLKVVVPSGLKKPRLRDIRELYTVKYIRELAEHDGYDDDIPGVQEVLDVYLQRSKKVKR